MLIISSAWAAFTLISILFYRENPNHSNTPKQPPTEITIKTSQKHALSPKLHKIEQVRHCYSQGLEQILSDDKVDMRGPSYEAIDIVGLDIEVYIESMDGSPVNIAT